MDKIKEFLNKFSSKTKKIAIAVAAAVVIFAVVVAVVLNNQPYEILFSGLSTEEAQQIIGKLQESEVAYKYEGDSILVKKDVLDKTKADLAYEGYPKSGFTYDVFKDNADIMTTDSDKRTYKIYELQDRIGATISMFDGVKDAKVMIALGEENKYALDDEKEDTGSASVTVVMEDGGSPTEKQVEGIQRLVSKSIPGLPIENVAVIDGAGNDVSVETDTSSSSNASAGAEIAGVVEKQMSNKVLQVLGPIYGSGNVKVAVNAKINMEKLVRETTTYETPEKKDENDKTGILSNESGAAEKSSGGTGAAGVAGTTTNADVNEYNTQGTNGTGNYENNSFDREYLVNQIKEQGQLDPGYLDDLTIAVTINGNSFGELTNNDILALVGNAAGIAQEDQADKITAVSAPFYEPEADKTKPVQGALAIVRNYLPFIIIGLAVLLLLIILFIILGHRRKKKNKNGEDDFGEEEALDLSLIQPAVNEELINLQNERGMELKNNVREFTEQNPEISAQLLKNWLHGGNQNES